MIRFAPGAALALAATLMLSLLTSAPAQAEEPRRYILATATKAGTYYPVGVALATVIKQRLEPETGISLSAISSAGSAENVKLTRENEAQFAILQGIYGAWAAAGEGPFESEGPQSHLTAITMLWPNAEHFAVHQRHAKTGTMADLAGMSGQRFSIGRRNSGAEGSGRFILQTLGIDPDGFNLVYLGYGPSADALQNGVIQGMNIPAGVPVSAVTRAMAAGGGNVRVLNFTPDMIAKLNARYNLWYPYPIPAGTYPNQPEVIETAAQPNVLAVRRDVDEDAVYRITKTIYENLAFLGAIHPATKAMSLDAALAGVPVRLHPGAERYFREAGVTIPENLTADTE